MELYSPFTLNEQYITIKKECATSFARIRRLGSSTSSDYSTGGSFTLQDQYGNPRSYSATEENLVTVLSAYGVHLSSLRQLARIHADEFDAELDVMSHIIAYFDISSKRLI